MPRRSDVLTNWASHGQISHRQAWAGQRFRALYDAAGMQGHAVMDPGMPPMSIDERRPGAVGARLMAQSELMEIRPLLGHFDFALVSLVVGAGQDIAGHVLPGGKADAYAVSQEQKRYLAHRIRDALGLMAARFAL